jgi:hypothetical protein
VTKARSGGRAGGRSDGSGDEGQGYVRDSFTRKSKTFKQSKNCFFDALAPFAKQFIFETDEGRAYAKQPCVCA